MSSMNTPFDDAFHTLLTDCRKLIIPIVNEVFHTHYSENQEVILFQNEIYMRQQNDSEEKLITDSSFAIVSDDAIQKRYHLECQSTTDGSMLIRMYEYDSQLALHAGVLEGSTLTINFPDSAILYLRHSKNTPDLLTVTINTSGGTVTYNIPALKVKQYTIDAIFDKRLFFLIPFHIFNHEANLKTINENEKMLKALQNEYAEIMLRLDEITAQGSLDEYTKQTICAMTNKVMKSLVNKYKNISKEVSDIMGGKILEYEAKTILNQGIEQGIEQGIQTGTISTLISLVNQGHLPIETAAKESGVSIEEFKKLMKNNK